METWKIKMGNNQENWNFGKYKIGKYQENWKYGKFEKCDR